MDPWSQETVRAAQRVGECPWACCRGTTGEYLFCDRGVGHDRHEHSDPDAGPYEADMHEAMAADGTVVRW